MAAPQAQAPLPEGWFEYKDPSTGNPYYHNPTTSTTTWDRPTAPGGAPAPAPVPAGAGGFVQQDATGQQLQPQMGQPLQQQQPLQQPLDQSTQPQALHQQFQQQPLQQQSLQQPQQVQQQQLQPLDPLMTQQIQPLEQQPLSQDPLQSQFQLQQTTSLQQPLQGVTAGGMTGSGDMAAQQAAMIAQQQAALTQASFAAYGQMSTGLAGLTGLGGVADYGIAGLTGGLVQQQAAPTPKPGDSVGKVKVWHEDKGFGFVIPEEAKYGGVDIFVHRSKLSDGQSLMVGSQVCFKAEWIAAKSKWAITELNGAAAGPTGAGGVAGAMIASGRGVASEKLFVAGLPLTADDGYVQTLFAAVGQVVDCKVLPENGRPNKAALVRMATMDQASQVISTMNNTMVPGTGQTLVIRFADNPGSGGARPMMATPAFGSIPGLTGGLPGGLGALGGYGKITGDSSSAAAGFSPYGSSGAGGPGFSV